MPAEIDPKEIEAVARALYRHRNDDPAGWQCEAENTRRLWRDDASIAITALNLIRSQDKTG